MRLSRSILLAIAIVPDGCATAFAENRAEASATIEPRSGSILRGWATFDERDDGKVVVIVHVEDAAPGEHGVHLHEKGNCSAEDASSAGDHFDPGGMPHGGPMHARHHAGDFGNIVVGEDGTGELELTTDDLTVRAGPRSVLRRSIVVHEKVDDLVSQPSGKSGARQGCGVVR